MFQNTTITLSVSTLAAIAFPLVLVLVLMVCLSCLKRKTAGGFSNFSNSADATNTTSAHVNNSFTLDIEDTNVDNENSTNISLEPLPDITSKGKVTACPLRPRIGFTEKGKSETSLKLIVAHKPFPRSQITYLKELGSGWFGKVIESDAENITTGVARSKVVVKMLKDDASKDEQQLFFEEVATFRELEHPHIMRLLGQCTEINPMLMILEYAALGNLKQYLRNHRHEQASLIQKNRLIQFALDTSSGLACLHGHDYLHKDLAARNCLVMSDHTVKIGDYGIAEDLYKEDYLSAGMDLLPIRWMAPETLKQDGSTWTSSDFSKESDIWSLGVVLWEIAMLGERPYDMLTDEAVLQGVIIDKDIRLPEPDIGMPNKDRLYEVMRFCWMDRPDRLKVDEVYKLLEQIASKSPETSSSNDAITTFEQKWEHLMPNQRHESVDSVDDQQGSLSSDDSNILDNSLEDLTATGVQATSLPLAPPRASRRKLSVRAVTIPTVDDVSEAAPDTDKKSTKEPSAGPQITIIDEAGHKTEVSQLPEVCEKPDKSKEPISSEMEFTEFTSHSTDEEGGEETPNVSQIDSGPALQDKTLPEKMDVDRGEAGDSLQADALSKIRETLEDDSLTFSTPDKPQGQVKARKTSTPVAKDEPSPSSSSSLSGGDSSATFVTAHGSSTSNLTDAYATASDSTLVTAAEFTVTSEASQQTPEDSSMNFEILDSTAVASVFSDSGKSEEDSHDAKVSDLFSHATTSNPLTNDGGTITKDDGFGDFTNGSLMDENNSLSPENSVAPPASATSASDDASATQNDFFKMTDESAEKVFKSETDSANKPATKEADPFVSFGTDLSSLSSLTVPKVTQSVDQEQIFPSFNSEFSSLNSLNTDSTPTPQAEPKSDIFAFDIPSPQESQKSMSGLEFLSSDLIASSSSLGIDELSAQSSAKKETGQPPPDLSANLSSIPLDSSSTFTSDSGHQSDTQQVAPDLLGLGDPESSMQDSSFEFLQAQENTKTSMSSSAFSDFDILSSFSSVPVSSASPSNPGSGDLQELAGSLLAADPTPAQKESQDGVLVASDPSKPSEASLLDFSAFESAGAENAAKKDEESTEKASSQADISSSLLDI